MTKIQIILIKLILVATIHVNMEVHVWLKEQVTLVNAQHAGREQTVKIVIKIRKILN
jgi:hypothetical protein